MKTPQLIPPALLPNVLIKGTAILSEGKNATSFDKVLNNEVNNKLKKNLNANASKNQVEKNNIAPPKAQPVQTNPNANANKPDRSKQALSETQEHESQEELPQASGTSELLVFVGQLEQFKFHDADLNTSVSDSSDSISRLLTMKASKEFSQESGLSFTGKESDPLPENSNQLPPTDHATSGNFSKMALSTQSTSTHDGLAITPSVQTQSTSTLDGLAITPSVQTPSLNNATNALQSGLLPVNAINQFADSGAIKSNSDTNEFHKLMGMPPELSARTQSETAEKQHLSATSIGLKTEKNAHFGLRNEAMPANSKFVDPNRPDLQLQENIGQLKVSGNLPDKAMEQQIVNEKLAESLQGSKSASESLAIQNNLPRSLRSEKDVAQEDDSGLSINTRLANFAPNTEVSAKSKLSSNDTGNGSLGSVRQNEGSLSPNSPPKFQTALESVKANTGVQSIAPNIGTKDWAQAIGQKLVWMSGNGEQSALLTLNPPNLGPLQISLSVNNHLVEANFISAHQNVREALEAAVPRLRELMDNAGMSLSGCSVSADTSSANNAFSQSNTQGRNTAQREINPQPRTDNQSGIAAIKHSGEQTKRLGSVDTFV